MFRTICHSHNSNAPGIHPIAVADPGFPDWVPNPNLLLPPANEVCEGYVFTGVCLSTGGVHGRGRGMHGRGHACWGMHVGGMHGRGSGMVGACMVGGMCGEGSAWQGDMHGRGTCMAGGMHGVGAFVVGVRMVGGMRGRYHEIQSMSGR